MSYQYITFNATCININDLKGVVINTFILQLISFIMMFISSFMMCTVYWAPFCSCCKCCKRFNNIYPNQEIQNNNTIEHI